MAELTVARFAERFTALTDKYKEHKGISITGQGDVLGVGGNRAYFYRSGASCPDIQVLARICAFYGVSADWLLGLSDDPRPHGRRSANAEKR